MRSSILLILICTVSFGCYCQAVKKYDIKDMHALNEVADKWERYWNIHNIDSLATLFASDIDFVTKAEPGLKAKKQRLTITGKTMQPYLKPVNGLQTVLP